MNSKGLPVASNAREKQVAGEFKQQCALPFAKNVAHKGPLERVGGVMRARIYKQGSQTIGSVSARVIATALPSE